MKRLFNVTFSLQKLWVLMFAASAFVIAGCSSDGDDVTPIPDEPEKPKPQDKTQVIVDVSTLEVPEGKTVDLRFKIVPSTVVSSSFTSHTSFTILLSANFITKLLSLTTI